jgi:hypothetical protein
MCKTKKHTSKVTTGRPKHSGIPCAMVLTVSFVISSVIGLFCHRHWRGVKGPSGLSSPVRQLEASVEASGPHDFAVRKTHARQPRALRPSHPAPDVRDDASAPPDGRETRQQLLLICPTAQGKFPRSNCFVVAGLDPASHPFRNNFLNGWIRGSSPPVRISQPTRSTW